MKVALAHDSLTQMGGAERVLQSLHEIYPEAPVFTLVYDKKLKNHFEDWTIVSSPLQYLYDLIPRFKLMLPFIPRAVRAFDFSEFDVVISSSSSFMRGINVPKNVIHINYCHTPARFLWSEADSYVAEEVPFFLRPIIKRYLMRLRSWDHAAAQRVDYFIANSKNVQERIKRFYGRPSEVIYPGVDIDYFHPTEEKQGYFLVAGRLQAHKKTNLVIETFKKLGYRLHVVGSGRNLAALKQIAGPNVEFFDRVEDKILRDQYSGAEAFIFPQEEDFGMMPVEALACGTPVIAYAKGGALETVIAGKTGVFFDEQNEKSLAAAVEKARSIKFQSEDLFEQAQNFSLFKFEDKIRNFVQKKYEDRH